MFLFPKLGRIKNETKVPALIKKGVIFPKLAKLYSRKVCSDPVSIVKTKGTCTNISRITFFSRAIPPLKTQNKESLSTL